MFLLLNAKHFQHDFHKKQGIVECGTLIFLAYIDIVVGYVPHLSNGLCQSSDVVFIRISVKT